MERETEHRGIHFYSRAPCEARPGSGKYGRHRGKFLLTRPMRGAAAMTSLRPALTNRFLLTRLMRGAANKFTFSGGVTGDFYSRASCEARRVGGVAAPTVVIISTHAPHARRGKINA